MSKQDRQGVRKATDLEQKYNFGKSFAEVMGLAKDAQDTANEALDATNKLDNNLTSDEIFNRLTENGALQGLYKEDGNIYINASYIKSGELHTIASTVYQASNYTSDDLGVMEQIMAGTITATEAQLKKYDLNGDGAITGVDHNQVKNLVNGNFSWYRFTWYAELNPTNRDSVLRVYYSIERSDGYSTAIDTLNVSARYVNEMVLPTPDNALPTMVATDWTGKVYTVPCFPIEMDGNYCMYRTLDDGTVEWINPPMALNKEYRTTERWGGKVLYTKIVDCGALPPNTTSTTAVGVSNAQVKSIEGVAISGDTALKIPSANVSVSASSNIIISTTDSTLTSYNAYVTLKYTKD